MVGKARHRRIICLNNASYSYCQEPQADLYRLIGLFHSPGIGDAKTPDKPRPVHRTDLAEDRDRSHRKACALACAQQHMHRAQRKADRRSDRRHDRYAGQPVGDVVLDDQRRPSLLNFPAYCRVEDREVDFTAPRIFRFGSFVSSRCHASLSTANQSAAISPSRSRSRIVALSRRVLRASVLRYETKCCTA
jgi:hypothetical protein